MENTNTKELIKKAIKDISRKYSDFSIAIEYFEQINENDKKSLNIEKCINLLKRPKNDGSRVLILLGVTEKEIDNMSKYN